MDPVCYAFQPMRTARGATLLFFALLLASACGDRACGGRGGLPPSRLPRVERGDGRSYHFLDKGTWKGYYDEEGRIAVAEYDSKVAGREESIEPTRAAFVVARFAGPS